MTKEQYLKIIETIIQSPRNDIQKITMLKYSFETFVADYNKKLVDSDNIECPYDDYGMGDCKFGWYNREQTCEECKLEWLMKQ